jgi:hypothetical protein
LRLPQEVGEGRCLHDNKVVATAVHLSKLHHVPMPLPDAAASLE